MKTFIFKIVILSISALLLVSCTEPYALQTNSYEEALVIEATITDELKFQEIKISKTYRLEESAPTIVSDAVVVLKDNLGNTYDFIEQSDKYVSVTPFKAEPNRQYQLKIITDNGKSYTSKTEVLTQVSPIQNITPRINNVNGQRGVEIVVNSFDPTNNSKYYRFEYEETNKIVAPRWLPVKAQVVYGPQGSSPPAVINLLPRTEEAQICFTTKKSDKIILTSTNDLTEDRVAFPVRFIANNDYLIANRYSILVKQYVQNLASYTYYKTLSELSGNESVLSQNQPGFFFGNLKSDDNPNEKVIGYFEVSSVSSQRIFFNFSDVFPFELLPKYPYKCDPDPILGTDDPEVYFKFCFDPFDFTCGGYSALQLLASEKSVYFNLVDNIYELYPTPCGDCTSFSSNIRPTFWID
ncbi:DUF4249 domain-containing protein [Flavobacterium sp.]|uniref:DUF4249 domain-containing protein n=1 Tax=Flavobacterium sp. TaxID=239 RepID=UPI0026230C50|nr:DUF4249 domain-containing protein [Flavobacterium sp.]